jgi:DNA-binding NarL/FixJ family response regulator
MSLGETASSPRRPRTQRGEPALQVLIVDDHPVTRVGLHELLRGERDILVCGEAADAEEAIEVAARLKPDLAVVDISMRGVNGLELIKTLRSRLKSVQILVLSMHDEALYAERALRAGAKGYVMKNESADTILEAVRSVARGQVYFSERIGERIAKGVAGGRPLFDAAPLKKLTDRELEVFEFIGRGVPTREIADRLHLSVKTIEAHRSKIKKKLRLISGVELLQRAVQWVQSGKVS